jgi:hypothetical protein
MTPLGLRGPALLATCALLCACSALRPEPEVRVVYQQAETRAALERIERLELELERLRADLKAAETALITAESGLKGVHTRADAVSALAEARIQLERAASSTPWRKGELDGAQTKLEEADRQVQLGHFGAAIFFASRAKRVSDALIHESQTAHNSKNTRWIQATRVNMRAGPSTRHGIVAVLLRNTPVFQERIVGDWALVRTPSGHVGWVSRSFLSL